MLKEIDRSRSLRNLQSKSRVRNKELAKLTGYAVSTIEAMRSGRLKVPDRVLDLLSERARRYKKPYTEQQRNTYLTAQIQAYIHDLVSWAGPEYVTEEILPEIDQIRRYASRRV
jgi:transcriptional regulator with XRE-family HTH domain